MHAPRTAPWCVLLGDVKTSKMFTKEHCKEASRDQCLAESSATCTRSRERIMTMIMIMIMLTMMMIMMMMMMFIRAVQTNNATSMSITGNNDENNKTCDVVGLHSRERTA